MQIIIDTVRNEITVIDPDIPEMPIIGKARTLDQSKFNTTTTNQVNTAITKLIAEFRKIE